MILNYIKSQGSGDVKFNQSTPLKNILKLSRDISINSIYWFKPYLATEFPEVICDKKYFFLYSTDHDSTKGGIWWGKGNNLDCSDFVEIGLIINNHQAETPFLYRFKNETEKIYLYYHTNQTEAGNNGVQRTRLMTTTGGLLHNTNWTDRGRPLGEQEGDNHNGYFRFWEYRGELRGVHYKSGIEPVHQKSTLSVDGLTSTRGETFLYQNLLPSNKYFQFPFGIFFELFGQLWWLGNIDYKFADRPPEPFQRIAICKCSNIFEISQIVSYVDNELFGYEAEYYIEGFTAHIYTKDGIETNAENLKYMSLDLFQLSSFL